MSLSKNTKNPFDDEHDAGDEEDDASVGHDRIDDYDPALDPFADDCRTCSAMTDVMVAQSDQIGNKSSEDHLSAMSKSGVYDCSTPIWSSSTRPFGNLDDCSSIKSMSRLSLTSNNSNSIAEQQLKQYSLGDGSLEKEGLLCPDCMLQCKTITELMNHFDGQHKSTKSPKSLLNMSAMSKQLLPANQTSFPVAQVGGQIKDFLNKFLVSPANKQLRTTIMSNDFDSRLNDLNRSDLYDSSSTQSWSLQQQQQFPNLISQWKNSMSQGPKHSHYEQFRTIRESRIERYVFETNKLLIRLDKLLRDYPPLADMVARRKHEQSVVDWVDESVVTLCPSCASKFNILTRKRHHCRLCGAVMCTKCCYFITFDFAYQLIDPIAINQSSKRPPSTQTSSQNVDSSQENSPFKMFLTKRIHRNPLGIVDQENVDKLRVCGDCQSLLVMRKEKIDVAHYKAPVVQLYEQLRDVIHQIDRLLPVYYRMANSIGMGESTYRLDNAHHLKHKLTKLGEEADILSRKVESCGMMDMEAQANDGAECSNTTGPCARQLSIQASIRRATVHYLRQQLLGLPELPDEQRFEELKQKHAESIDKRIQMDKQIASLEQERFESSRLVASDQRSGVASGNQTNITIGDSEDAFCPQITSSCNSNLWSNMNDEERAAILQEEDPILQQINIIRSYIRQANDNHRYEEVAMLQHNLQQLNIEYYFDQQNKKKKKKKKPQLSNTNPFDEDDNDDYDHNDDDDDDDD